MHSIDLTVSTPNTVSGDTRTWNVQSLNSLPADPIGESRLREIFLKTDNHIQGQYLAEVTKGECIVLLDIAELSAHSIARAGRGI